MDSKNYIAIIDEDTASGNLIKYLLKEAGLITFSFTISDNCDLSEIPNNVYRFLVDFSVSEKCRMQIRAKFPDVPVLDYSYINNEFFIRNTGSNNKILGTGLSSLTIDEFVALLGK
jgi:hypothetical protein